MIYYQIYSTVNKINGKSYIGQHRQESREKDEYLGSGLHLKRAIKKYGISSFEKYILEVCETREQADFLEKRYIKYHRHFGKCEYNLANGGEGSWEYINKNRLNVHGKPAGMSGKHHSDKTKKIISITSKGRGLGVPKSEEHKRKISEKNKVSHKNKKLSEEHIKNISIATKGRKWFNNGVKSVHRHECPEGFDVGRISWKKL